MLFSYKIVTKEGRETVGDIEALNQDVAVNSLQRSGSVVVSIRPVVKKNFFEYDINIFSRVTLKDVAISSRQIATLLEAHVPALKTFRLLAAESEKSVIRSKFAEIADDIQNGVSISDALYKHPSVFSDFYVNMIRAGEESGKLSETFLALADHLERTYEALAKARGALIYPVFVITTFVVVMILMLTLIIPKLSEIIIASGQDVPFYTTAIMAASSFLINYGALVLVVLILAALLLWKSLRGTNILARAKLQIFGVGTLYQMLYLSRISAFFYYKTFYPFRCI
jgi:type II secretory pathway component PulF